MKMTTYFYHVCSSGTFSSLMFRCNPDFITGLNDIIVCSLKFNIEIYAFCLMNNHVHFLVKGDYVSIRRFMRMYLSRRFIIMRKKYGEIKNYADIDICIKQIQDINYLRGVCGYILRNPMAAGMNVIPTAYPWSSASLYFLQRDGSSPCKPLSALSTRLQRRLFSTKERLPQDLLIDENSRILPEQYVKVTEMENIFSSPSQFAYYLSKNNDLEYEADSGILRAVKFRDDELFHSLEEISRERFGLGYQELSIEKRCIATIAMAKRFRTTTARAARISSLPPELLHGLIGRR